MHGSRMVDEARFPLAADQFFMLGDNSAESKDGRLWEADQEYPGSGEHWNTTSNATC